MSQLFIKAFQLINRWIPILIQTPRGSSFGNCAEEMFFGLLRAKRENKKILFLHHHNLFFRKPIANKKLFHLHSEHSNQNKGVFYLGTWIITVVFVFIWVLPSLFRLHKLRRPLELGRARVWRPDNEGAFSWETLKEQNWKKQYEDYVPPRLVDNDHRIAEHMRVQMGIPLADWFVCLHVRESGYRGDSSVNRNASIKHYEESLKVITGVGGWVVRLGDPSMKPIAAMDRVIDYPHTRFKSELMDLYLLSQCRFFFGTNSGPCDVASLFAKPMVLVNSTEWAIAFPVKRGDIVITKHLYSHSAGRYLSVREILTQPFTWQAFSALDSEYTMVENTPEEIKNAIEEFLSQPEHYEYSELQEEFIERRTSQVHRWVSRMVTETVQQYRIASRGEPSAGTLGRKYLEQNWFTDVLERSSATPLVDSSK